MQILLFQCVGVSWTCCCGITGFRWCHVALVSVGNVLAFAFYHLIISGVSWSCCLWLWLICPASLCWMETMRADLSVLFLISDRKAFCLSSSCMMLTIVYSRCPSSCLENTLPSQLLFCCCDKTPWLRQLPERRACLRLSIPEGSESLRKHGSSSHGGWSSKLGAHI